MNEKYSRTSFFSSDSAFLLYMALFGLLIHLVINLWGGYGFFRDEFYYIACSEHLDFGYVDHPPLSVALLALVRSILGNSLFAIRFLPALSGAFLVLLTGSMARQLGGGRFAQSLAALSAIIAPEFLSLNNFYSMNSFDLLLWALGAYVIILIIQKQDHRLWLLLGLIMGIGLLNKISMLWFGFGLFAGLLLTPDRKSLLKKWPWLAALLAFLIFLPHVIWQINHDWPTLEFIRNATAEKMAAKSPLEFMAAQILSMHPFTFPIWLMGLFYFLFFRKGKRFRILGIIYIVILILLILNQKSRTGYLAPAYPMLFASGSLVIERFIRRRDWNWLKPAVLSLLLMGGVISAPLVFRSCRLIRISNTRISSASNRQPRRTRK